MSKRYISISKCDLKLILKEIFLDCNKKLFFLALPVKLSLPVKADKIYTFYFICAFNNLSLPYLILIIIQ